MNIQTTAFSISAEQKNRILTIITDMQRNFARIELIVVATTDGFVLTHSGARSAATPLVERCAAIVSSLSALSEAGGKELGGNRLDMTILNFNNLNLLTLKVKAPYQDLILAVAANTETSLGNLLWFTREAAEKIKNSISITME